jgi:hypothetical protein
MSKELDKVTTAKMEYKKRREDLEALAREKLDEDLFWVRSNLNQAVRNAVNAGESKAAVMRALGTKNFDTIKFLLERTK